MLFILLFIIMWFLDRKFDTYLLFRVLGTFILGGMLFLVGICMANSNATNSDIPILQETFATSGFTRNRYGDKFFVYANENGTSQVSADSIQVKQGTKNEIKTYTKSYPKIYKIMFFFPDKLYYKVEIKPWQRLFSLL